MSEVRELIRAAKNAEVWLANCTPIGKPTDEYPLPPLRKAIDAVEAKLDTGVAPETAEEAWTRGYQEALYQARKAVYAVRHENSMNIHAAVAIMEAPPYAAPAGGESEKA